MIINSFIFLWKSVVPPHILNGNVHLSKDITLCIYALCLENLFIRTPPFPLDLHQNGLSLGHALLGLSPSAPPGPKEGDLATHDTGHETKRASTEKG